jgi:heterodisulfide reductase subunit A-like polyferredoxin
VALVVERLANSLRAHKATIFSDTIVEAIVGSTGRYEVTLRKGKREYVIRVGAIVLAGGQDDEHLRVLQMLHLPSLKPPSAEEPGALEPGRTVSPAVFLCQTTQSIRESAVIGSAVASKVAGFLAKDEIAVAPNTATVDVSRCRGCRKCEKTCEYGAVKVVAGLREARSAQVDELLCRGCGTCAAHCPTGAIRAGNFAPGQFESFLQSLLVGV